MKIIVTTYPFGEKNDAPNKLIKDLNVNYNTVGRKYSKEEHIEVLKKEQPDIIIAGTETYTSKELDLCPNLKMISRVGIGLDSVDLVECKKRNIIVTYTPDAPSNAVAELTLGVMIDLARRVTRSDKIIRDGNWSRYIGKDIRECNVGIIGFGRIGKLLAEKIVGLKPRRIFINDTKKELCKDIERCEYETRSQILASCDIISIHIPYDHNNHHLISEKELDIMKKDAIIINTSRGDIIKEDALYDWLIENPEASACVDTFVEEPYSGKLCELNNIILTPHLGSCTVKSRLDMEVGAGEEVLNFLNDKEFNNRVV